ncbi:hypothetical protein RLEG3_02780 (plasmid) [Rhizobium leguminosarum bv. trifolii WSM1689]|uniref:thioredoxin family protein n=1 Tax=Rhizobium leguminosarum TaxID=384 RepID=UPI0003E09E43|nr:thioredoxin domain-containing protein [Rhizobium leguminosarum]AHF88024.1 hypothetical protein RLEG3_02780 [Rhizobium leguminosarum bv. trifolii WSM1689]
MASVMKIDNFESEVLGSSLPVLVYFWAAGCNPCSKIAPILEEIAAEMKGIVKVVKLNINENPELAARYIQQPINEKFAFLVVPTLVIFNDGKNASTLKAQQPKSDIEKWIRRTVADYS